MLSRKGSFGASKNPAWSEWSFSENRRYVALFLNSLCIITPSETTKVWRTRLSNQNSRNFQIWAPSVPARDSVVYCATIIEKPHEFASFEFLDSTGPIVGQSLSQPPTELYALSAASRLVWGSSSSWQPISNMPAIYFLRFNT